MQPHQSASIIRDKQLLYVCNDVYMIYGDCSLSAFVCMTFTLEISKVSRKALLTTFQHVLKPKGQDRSFSDDSQNVRWRVPVWLGFSHHSYLVRFWKGHGLGWNKWYVMYSKLRSSSLSPRWKWKWKFFTHSFTPTSPLPTLTLPLFMLRHLTGSFALVIITMATRGHHLTININMDHNKQLTQVCYTAMFGKDNPYICMYVCVLHVWCVYTVFSFWCIISLWTAHRRLSEFLPHSYFRLFFSPWFTTTLILHLQHSAAVTLLPATWMSCV